MLKNLSLSLFFFLCIFSEVSGYFWELEQSVVLDGVLRRAERTITKRENGKVEDIVERSIVLVTDKPLVLTHSVSLEKQPIVSAAITYPHIQVYLPEEFLSLIEKHVQCNGTFRKTFNPHDNEIEFHIDTALDSDQLSHQLKTFFYEPEEVYPGPPEYTSVKMGDRPEKAVFLTLKEPINVELKKNTEQEEDILNTPEKGVRELQVVFSDFQPLAHQINQKVLLKGTLYHAHTAHHHRRVLMIVNSWKLD
jgi:hypothetical protein